jgi:predicted acyl esterase
MLRLTRFVGLTASLLFATAHAHAAALYSSLQLEPVTIDGESIHLQMRIDRPAGTGKFPTLVYNHGSTGFGIYTRRFKQPVDAPAIAAFFVERGWAVVMPARRGRNVSMTLLHLAS